MFRSSQSAMKEITDGQEKGQITEDDMKDMETQLAGMGLLTSWKGTKFEVSGVLRQTVDVVLTKEQGVSEAEVRDNVVVPFDGNNKTATD
jgi:hypothetical protein